MLCKDVDALTTELIATKSQLASKCEAIQILSKQLQESLTQTDQFKLMTDQLQERYKTLKRALGTDTSFVDSLENSQKNVFLQLKMKVHESEVANRILESEAITLRRRVAELSDDLNIFRKKSSQNQDISKLEEGVKTRLNDAWERESLVSQLEDKSLECSRLKRELQLCQDEKNDLLAELHIYKNKIITHPAFITTSIPAEPILNDASVASKEDRMISAISTETKCNDNAMAATMPSDTILNSRQISTILVNDIPETYENGPDVFDDTEPITAT